MSETGDGYAAFNEVLGKHFTNDNANPVNPEYDQRPLATESNNRSPSPNLYYVPRDGPRAAKQRALRQGSSLRRTRNQETDKETLTYIIASSELQLVFKSLKAHVVWHTEALDRHSEDLRLMVFEEPFHDLFFARDELESFRSSTASPTLKDQIGVVLSFIDKEFADTISDLARLRDTETISFGVLWTLFPPGSIVYGRWPTAQRGTVYEHCGVVEYVYDSLRDGQSCQAVVFKEWRFTENNFYRLTAYRVIAKFKGDRDVVIDVNGDRKGLPMIPLERVPKTEQTLIRERLVERSRKYLQLHKTPVSLWQYEGPVFLGGDTGNMLTKVFSRPGPHDKVVSGNWIVDERVVFDEVIASTLLGPPPEAAEILDTTASISDDNLIILSGYVSVYLVDTEMIAWRAIVSRLRPVEWYDDPLYSFKVSQKDMVESLVSHFSPYDRLTSSMRIGALRPKAGLVFWPSGPAKDCREFASAVAELARKPLYRVDLLSIVKATAKAAKDSDEDDSHKDNSDPSDIFSMIMARLTDVLRWSPVLILENCGAWMERRLLEKARHCENVTRFSELLEFYPAILVLLPGQIKDLDPMFEQLSMIRVEVASSPTAPVLRPRDKKEEAEVGNMPT